MGRHVQDIRELLRAARTLRSSAEEALQQPYAKNLLHAAEELEEHARLLANARPGEVIDMRKEEALHAPVDMRV